MVDIEKKIAIAKSDKHALNNLIFDYIPFIKKQVYSANLALDFEDMFSIAMITFSICVTEYDEKKGSFIAFATKSIRNRLIDEMRKEGRHTEKVIFFPDNDESLISYMRDISVQKYNIEHQRENLAYEIQELLNELLSFGINFRKLTKNCPRQDRARNLCFRAAKLLLSDKDMKKQLFCNKRLPRTELAKQLGISTKTIEKHRKFIVTLSVIWAGDYPNIKSFLPLYKEV